MSFFKNLFYKFGASIGDCFRGRNIVWQILAVVSTAILAFSGFDYAYLNYWNHNPFSSYLFSAALVGLVVPVFLPVYLLLRGWLLKNPLSSKLGYALAQGALSGWLLSAFYKSLTGRSFPFESISAVSSSAAVQSFRIGFWRGGIFFGWPSSHTSVAFAMAAVVWQLFPENKLVKGAALAYALFIGIGVSATIHWFSDFTAGIIFGTIVGTAVGRAYKNWHPQQ